MYALTKKLSKILLLASLTIFLSISCSNSQTLKCTRVIDGDTIVLNNGEKVRLIGVDTPESVHPLKPVEYFSKEASEFTKRLVEGKEIKLGYDWQKRDKYDRLLAYVYLNDGTFLNAEIIKQGYGFAYTRFPFKYLDQFRQYEKEARENKKGLWRDGGKGELNWVLEEGQKPFLIHQMSNKLWAIKYNGFIKTRISDEELMTTLTNIRQWVHEFHEEDLARELLNNGWEKE